MLVGAAILEERLTRIFQVLFDSKQAPRKLQESIFDSNGPLSTFSAKIKLAYSLGLIDRSSFEDLETVRRIRNRFAHTPKQVEFIGSVVSTEIERMHCVQAHRKSMPRFSNTGMDSPPTKLQEAELRAQGYVKYTKSIFTLGVMSLQVELTKAATNVLRSNA